jgi:hypothetical protein
MRGSAQESSHGAFRVSQNNRRVFLGVVFDAN